MLMVRRIDGVRSDATVRILMLRRALDPVAIVASSGSLGLMIDEKECLVIIDRGEIDFSDRSFFCYSDANGNCSIRRMDDATTAGPFWEGGLRGVAVGRGLHGEEGDVDGGGRPASRNSPWEMLYTRAGGSGVASMARGHSADALEGLLQQGRASPPISGCRSRPGSSAMPSGSPEAPVFAMCAVHLSFNVM